MNSTVGRHGQAGFEFLAVSAFGLMLLVGISLFLLGRTGGERDDASLRQAQQSMTVLGDLAQDVWAQGRYSWFTADITLPDGTRGLYTVEDNTLVIDIDTSYGRVSQPYFMPVPVSGGYDVLGPRTSAFPLGNVRGGPVKIRVENNGTHVLFLVQ